MKYSIWNCLHPSRMRDFCNTASFVSHFSRNPAWYNLKLPCLTPKTLHTLSLTSLQPDSNHPPTWNIRSTPILQSMFDTFFFSIFLSPCSQDLATRIPSQSNVGAKGPILQSKGSKLPAQVLTLSETPEGLRDSWALIPDDSETQPSLRT